MASAEGGVDVTFKEILSDFWEKILSNQSMFSVLAPAATVVPVTPEILRQLAAS